MARSKDKNAGTKDVVKDEPGAEERFKGILKRALNTPPPRKQTGAAKPPPKKRPR